MCAICITGKLTVRSTAHTGRLDLGSTADTLRALMENQLARRKSPNSPSNPLKRTLGDFFRDTWEPGFPGSSVSHYGGQNRPPFRHETQETDVTLTACRMNMASVQV